MLNYNHRRIPRIPLRVAPDDEAGTNAVGFKYASPDIGQRHQLGGSPTWIQQDETPQCPHCGQEMTFYGQLDSIGDGFVIADCGMIYIFLCFDCNHSESRVQSF
jgi:hypothetical protein